ncbi:MAG: FAD-dependent thymidylate synthase, partial [Actinobacteria bacterium]|nr:FAD-dependent thymidylate synthase [Actinomycetota bacterium]
EPEFYTPTSFPSRATNKKQGADHETLVHHLEAKNGDDVPTGEWLQHHYQTEGREAYEMLLEHGVAPESARGVLPQAMYTEWYWKIDLHNLLHFLSLRTHEHAQKEIRDYAFIMQGLLEASGKVDHTLEIFREVDEAEKLLRDLMNRPRYKDNMAELISTLSWALLDDRTGSLPEKT